MHTMCGYDTDKNRACSLYSVQSALAAPGCRVAIPQLKVYKTGGYTYLLVYYSL